MGGRPQLKVRTAWTPTGHGQSHQGTRGPAREAQCLPVQGTHLDGEGEDVDRVHGHAEGDVVELGKDVRP